VSGKRSSPNTSSRLGFVATFDVGGGELVTLHRSGRGKKEMLAEACDDVAARWPDAKLVCYSTPDTISSDLNGRGDVRRAGFPESRMLSIVRRRAMLHPRLAGDSNPRAQRWRERQLERDVA
jgi:hypothetical protein